MDFVADPITDNAGKVKVSLVEFPDLGFGYDIEILAEDATAGDYIAALDAWQERYLAQCKGCDGCCRERAPLTLPDFYPYQAAFPQAADILSWLAWCGQVVKLPNGAVDILLKRVTSGACTFLIEDMKICREHAVRSLVCHTHVCLPKSSRADALRTYLVNRGEDALVAAWLAAGGDGSGVDREGYPLLPDFQQPWQNLMLKKVLPSDLWLELWGKEGEKTP